MAIDRIRRCGHREPGGEGIESLDETKPKHRFVALDSWRGIAACAVVLLHAVSPGHISNLSFVQHGWMFVDFFFVLSGFVIGSSYGDRVREGFSISRFMWLRLWRVYPLHLFMLLMFLVQIFVGPDAMSWNWPSWSIAAEVWAYLIFAFILRFGSRFLVPICLAIIVCATAIIPTVTDRYLMLFHDGALVRCLLGFSLGILGWHVWPAWQKAPLGRLATPAELVIVAAVFALVTFTGAVPLSLAAPPLFFVAVMLFARQEGAVSRLLTTAPFVLLGTLSYSIYMIHGFLLFRFVNGLSVLGKLTHYPMVSSSSAGNHIGGGPWLADLAVLVFLGTVIFCSFWTYRLIEEPCRKLGRRLDKAGFPRVKPVG